MRRYLHIAVGLALSGAGIGCQGENGGQATDAPASQTSSAEAPAQEHSHTGTVLETMNTSGYTYVLVDTGTEKVWAAAPEFAVNVGDRVTVPPGMAMRNHRSNTLGRDFDLVYFVQSVAPAGAAAADGQAMPGELPAGHPQISPRGAAAAATTVDFAGIEVPPGGTSVANIYANKSALAGQAVLVRGKVVKVSTGIMGKNWIHLRDGTGGEGTDDLTVTTQAIAEVGDLVLARGVLVVDRDFGYGYKYDVIIEDGQITPE